MPGSSQEKIAGAVSPAAACHENCGRHKHRAAVIGIANINFFMIQLGIPVCPMASREDVFLFKPAGGGVLPVFV